VCFLSVWNFRTCTQILVRGEAESEELESNATMENAGVEEEEFQHIS
jgi:hypothetical protein